MLEAEFGVTDRVRGKIIRGFPPEVQKAFWSANRKVWLAAASKSRSPVDFTDAEKEAMQLFEFGITQAQKRRRVRP